MSPLTIGLTGGIAAGKSEALAAFERLGAATISSDAVVHELLDAEPLLGRLTERWGVDIAPEGRIDRTRIGEIVFADPEELSWLEAQIHPLVGERIGAWLASLPAEAAIAVVEVPLLFESEMEAVFDTTVAVVTSDEVRRQRAEARGHALVGERDARQLASGGEGGAGRARGRERRHARGSRAAPVRLGREAGGMTRGRNRGMKNRRRRRLLVGAAAVAAGIVAGVLLGVAGTVDRAIQELTLPLRHEDVIRQQSREKDVDAALIAAVIYSESKFSDRTSGAGARGLMQITPDTANEIERDSGGTTFKLGDLADPEINIRYGTFLLRELLDRYDDAEVAALAAYNAGPSNVDRWGGGALSLDEIGFPETRAYVEEVLDKKRAYRDEYARELGY